MDRRSFLKLLAATGSLAIAPALAAKSAWPTVAAYRNPGCGCCEAWADAMRASGFTVSMEDDDALQTRATNYAIPEALLGCHVAVVGKYILSGHVPPEDVQTMLAQSPAIIGLAVPGMPIGSPGMEDGTAEPFKVYAFASDGTQTVFATHNYI